MEFDRETENVEMAFSFNFQKTEMTKSPVSKNANILKPGKSVKGSQFEKIAFGDGVESNLISRSK